VGLEGFEEAYPREMSGGMKQRVGIARALVMEKPLLLLDEPFSSLDVLTAEALQAEVQNIFLKRTTAARSMILVTHSIQEAVFMANRILVMGINPGRIRSNVVNPLPFPRDDQSADFQRMMASVRELVTEVLLPDAPAPSEAGTLRFGRGVDLAPPETIPVVHVNEVIGLLETVADQGGTANIFEVAHRTGKEFGKVLFLVKAAELFDLVDTPKQSIVLTPLGKRFTTGDINARKKIFRGKEKCLWRISWSACTSGCRPRTHRKLSTPSLPGAVSASTSATTTTRKSSTWTRARKLADAS
jgi:NitT/TauT family transport system ATP-binding protein